MSELMERAPDTLAPRVLVATGLADGWFERESPLFGRIVITFNDSGVNGCWPRSHRWAPAKPDRRLVQVDPPAPLAAAVDRMLATGRTGKVPVDLSGLSPFAQAVLTKTAEIPPGEVRPYNWVANEIGHPLAVRAVGSALGKNPIPFLIPCHRVVRSDGSVGNYGFGSPMKRRLLTAEGAKVK